MYIEQEDILKHISAKPFHLISEAADELGVEAYVIGGYVRDIFLHRPSKDIDVVAVGSGIAVKMEARARDAAETADGRVETAAAEVRWGREVRRDARGQWDQQGRWGR